MSRTAVTVTLTVLLFVGAGCLGGDGMPDGGAGGDGGGAPDGAQPDGRPSGCGALPDPAPAWLTDYQRELIAPLTGAAPIAAGVTITNRATAANRERARQFLLERLGDLGLEASLHVYETGANVWATLPATGAATGTLVVGAHFDTVANSPGANDNATGVAAVLAVARYLGALECRSHDVIFALFDQEEIGYVGSWHFAKMLFDDGVDIVAVHSIDQMGWDADGDRAIELERPDAGLFDLYAQAVADGGFAIPLIQTNTGGTDHVAFREFGFPAVGLTEEYVSGDTTPHYHQPSDTYATVDFAYLASTTTLVSFALARSLTQ